MVRNDCKMAKCKSCPFHFESEFNMHTTVSLNFSYYKMPVTSHVKDNRTGVGVLD